MCGASRRCGPIAARVSAQGGPFLFGKFGAADAMYAPVVARFHTYAVEVSGPSRAYMDAVMALPAWREWHAAALKETWVLRRRRGGLADGAQSLSLSAAPPIPR